MDSLGLRLSFDGGRSTAMAKPDRAWKLWHATRGLLRRRRLSGELLRVYLGLANFHFQLMRPALSIFSACYKFAAESIGRQATVWPSVRTELRMALGLIFLEYDMSAKVCSEVHIGDSSDRGYGMMTTDARHPELRQALLHQEKWRFILSAEPDLTLTNDREIGEGEKLGFRGGVPQAGLGRDTEYGRGLAARADEAYASRLQATASSTSRTSGTKLLDDGAWTLDTTSRDDMGRPSQMEAHFVRALDQRQGAHQRQGGPRLLDESEAAVPNFA